MLLTDFVRDDRKNICAIMTLSVHDIACLRPNKHSAFFLGLRQYVEKQQQLTLQHPDNPVLGTGDDRKRFMVNDVFLNVAIIAIAFLRL